MGRKYYYHFPLLSKCKQVNEVIIEWNLQNIRDKENMTHKLACLFYAMEMEMEMK